MRLSLTLCALLACLLCLETGASLAQSSDWSNLIEYGRQALDKGNFDGAETALRSAISGAESEHVSALRYIEAYELLGDVYLRKRDYKRAEEQYLYALEVTKDKPDDPATAFTLQQLASVYAHQNLYLQAEPYLRRALRVWEKEGRKYDADRLRCLESLTLVCDSQGKLLDGERFHKAAHALSDKLTRRAGKAAQPVARKPLDPNSAAAIYERAIARIKQGDKAGYEASLREALAAADAEGADGANRKLKDRVLNSLAQLLTDQHKYDEAAALRLKAVELIENAEGANASSLVHPLTSLGSLYIKSGKIAPAESVLTRALGIVYGREGAQPMDATLTLFALGDLYKKKGGSCS